MNDLEMNCAVAESRGWRWYRLPHSKIDGDRRYRCLFLECVLCGEEGPPVGFTPADMTERVCNWEYMKREGLVSDFVNDLDAMHEAIYGLDGSDLVMYRENLAKVVERDCGKILPHSAILWLCIDATAHQRAEAYLRALGKWRD